MDFKFGFSSGGGGGTGFTSTNSYVGVKNLIVGDITVSTTMTSKPKFVSIQDSTGTDISAGLIWQSVLSGSLYNIIITSGSIIKNVTINAYGA
jgi:hypothetical protein